MGVGEKATKNHIKGFREEIKEISKISDKLFFNWFDESGGNIDLNFKKGSSEFIFYFLNPARNFLTNLNNKTILEIGYGGGRLLAEASKHFKVVIGVDIHDDFELVKSEFKKRNIFNYKLLQNDGRYLPLTNFSVDIVYSYIVFQHVEKIEIFKTYIDETFRVLNKNGIAILFFGRLKQESVNTSSKILYLKDIIFERFNTKGYKEINNRINCVNLTVSLTYAKKYSKSIGFSILSCGVSKKLPKKAIYGGQHFLILKKKS